MKVQCINGHPIDDQVSSRLPDNLQASMGNSMTNIEFTEEEELWCTGSAEDAVLDAMVYISPDSWVDDKPHLIQLARVVRDYMIAQISPSESSKIEPSETERHSEIDLADDDKEMCADCVKYSLRKVPEFICHNRPAVDPAEITAAVRHRIIQILQQLDCRDLIERSCYDID
jgi:hypothetical protein